MKFAFIIPWYGINIPGGSESACRNIAERLVTKGFDVDILTTCVKQFNSDWNENYYKPGIELLNGVVVKRFKVRKRNTRKFDEVNAKLINNTPISQEEEQIFLNEMINSTDLEKYLVENKRDYSAFIFLPYMFGTTYFGAQRVLNKAILIPAFHDESYAYFQSFKDIYSRVKGMIFFSSAESDWANRHYSLENVKQQVLGLGIDKFASNPVDFIKKYNIENPFILYAGRKDKGKNVHVLLNYFSRYKAKKKGDINLVLIGGGDIEIPEDIKESVIDLGFISEEDKYNAYGAAQFLINPSANESFSIVLMESWFSGRPVLVNEHCSVTKRFCNESNGGLYYSNFNEFETCVELMLTNTKLSNSMGLNGKRFVTSKFDWNSVIEKYAEFIINCTTGVE